MQTTTSATIGVDFKVKILDVGDKKYKLTIWVSHIFEIVDQPAQDTAGQERFRTLTSSYYRGAQGVILVYDVSSRSSFEHLNAWFNELDTYTSSNAVIKMIGMYLSLLNHRLTRILLLQQWHIHLPCMYIYGYII